jgi:N4-gp56 family major capsid protein
VEDVLPALASKSFTELATIYYQKAVLDHLKQNLVFTRMAGVDAPLPKRAGKTIKWYRHNQLSAV